MMDDEKEFHGLDLRLARLARFLIRRRREALIIQVVVLIGCIWAISGMRLHDDPNAWPPHTDSFVKLNKRIADRFGGANSVSIQMSVDDGTIFTVENLGTIKDITDALYSVHGIIPYAVRSIAEGCRFRTDLFEKPRRRNLSFPHDISRNLRTNGVRQILRQQIFENATCALHRSWRRRSAPVVLWNALRKSRFCLGHGLG